jgi:hypothetical protein
MRSRHQATGPFSVTIGTTAYNSGNTFPAFYDPLGRYFTLGATMQS